MGCPTTRAAAVSPTASSSLTRVSPKSGSSAIRRWCAETPRTSRLWASARDRQVRRAAPTSRMPWWSVRRSADGSSPGTGLLGHHSSSGHLKRNAAPSKRAWSYTSEGSRPRTPGPTLGSAHATPAQGGTSENRRHGTPHRHGRARPRGPRRVHRPAEPTATTTAPPTASATPTPGLTEEQRIVVSVWEAWQRKLAIASCMADHGFTWTPEPYPAEPGFDPFLAQLGIDCEAWRAAAEARADAAFATNATYRDALDADSPQRLTLARWGLTWELAARRGRRDRQRGQLRRRRVGQGWHGGGALAPTARTTTARSSPTSPRTTR